MFGKSAHIYALVLPQPLSPPGPDSDSENLPSADAEGDSETEGALGLGTDTDGGGTGFGAAYYLQAGTVKIAYSCTLASPAAHYL